MTARVHPRSVAARLLRVALTLALVGGASFAQDRDARERVQALLADPCDDWQDVPALQSALTGVGPAAVAPLFDAYAAHAVDHPLLGSIGLGRRRGVAVEGALEMLGSERVLQHLATLVPGGTAREREAGLRLARKLAKPGDLGLVGDLAAPKDAEPGEVLTERWVEVLEVLLARDPDVVRVLGRTLGRQPRPLRPATVRFLGAQDSLAAFRSLLDTVGQPTQVEDLVLLEILEGLRRGHRPTDWEVAKLTNQAAYSSREGRALLAHTFGAIRDPRTVPELLEMVGEERSIAAPACEALRRIAVLNMPADEERWRGWHEREQAWYGARWSKCVFQLESDDFARSAAALREMTTHPLFAVEIAAELERVLRGEDEPLIVLACSALAHLGVRGQEGLLVALLQREEEALREAAAAALAGITGLDHGEDHQRWSVWLDGTR